MPCFKTNTLKFVVGNSQLQQSWSSLYTLHSCGDCLRGPLSLFMSLVQKHFLTLDIDNYQGCDNGLSRPTHAYTNAPINPEWGGWEFAGWDQTEDTKKKKNSNPVKCQHPPAALYFSLSLPSTSQIFCHIGVEPESSHAKLGHTHTNPYIHQDTEDKRERKSGEESVDLRGQMKECWSVDVVLTIALCHISKADCLKRIIYIS